MSHAIEPVTVPLTMVDGVWRVTGTRIPLERIVDAYLSGESAEGIVDAYDTLRIEDVYTLIGYYLHNRAAVDAYMEQRRQACVRAREENERRFPQQAGLKERLLARAAARQRDE